MPFTPCAAAGNHRHATAFAHIKPPWQSRIDRTMHYGASPTGRFDLTQHHPGRPWLRHSVSTSRMAVSALASPTQLQDSSQRILETLPEGGSVDIDVEHICDQESCPFPGHDAFSHDVKQRRLRNRVQLSCYADAIGTGLPDLQAFMDQHLKEVVGGLHLLPIYPSSGDGGFAPLTYKEVDPRLGSWGDVEEFAADLDLELELMVNHISPASTEFQDFLAKGDDSEYAEMFVDWDKFWPQGRPTEEDLLKIRTRKPEEPVLEVKMGDGSTRRLWCTFGPQQIDINPFSAAGAKFIEESLTALCRTGAKIVRLDAFGYCTKKPGTRCFCEEPEVWQLLERLNAIANSHGTRLLCEVHEEYQTNLQIAAHGYWCYDFALPVLVLHAFHFKTATVLRNWLRICPRRQFTVLDTHDGMGIDDIAGLAPVCDVQQLGELAEERLKTMPSFKYMRQEGGTYNSFPHQFNSTYFSACAESPRAYLLARAIQFFTPGVPMVYYVGLLAGSNDEERAAMEGPRGVNRHRYSPQEAAEELERPVVKALLGMCKLRNKHPAFNGQIAIKQEEDACNDHKLQVTWRDGRHYAILHADLATLDFHVCATAVDNADQEQTICYHLQDDTTTWGREAVAAAATVDLDGLRVDAAFDASMDQELMQSDG